MKITHLRAVQPPTPGSPADWRTQLGQIVVEVQTDEGATGIGVGGGGRAGIHLVETVLRDLLVGRDPSDVEGLHAEMVRHTAFYGRSGLVVMALSGVDLALWDLRGRVAGKPVAELLNARVDLGRQLPTYATVFGEQDVEQAITAGHAAVKLHVERFGDRPDVAQLVHLVADVRHRAGEQAMIMLDAFARWDEETAFHVAESLSNYHLAWLEEPLPPDNLAGYHRLVEWSPIPIAGGEHEYLTSGFQYLIEHHLHAVLQPDINWCGGLTTLVEIYRMAHAAGLRVCPHRGCEPYALHAIAALDAGHALAESPRSWFNCLLGAPAIEEGKIRLSPAAGFGVTVDPSIWNG